jgi:hypothetical protein
MTANLKKEHYERIKKDVDFWREEIWGELSLGTRAEILMFEALDAMEKVEKEFEKWVGWRERMEKAGRLDNPTIIEDNPTGVKNKDGSLKKNFRA